MAAATRQIRIAELLKRLWVLPSIGSWVFRIAKSVIKYAEDGLPYEWTNDCQAAFHTLKQMLVAAPVLSYSITEERFILVTDASNVGIGAILFQIEK